MGLETPGSIVQLGRCRKGSGNSLLPVTETSFRLVTRSNVGGQTTRLVLTAQNPPHHKGYAEAGQREESRA